VERVGRELSSHNLTTSPLFVLLSGRALLDSEGEAHLRLGKGERVAFSEIRSLLSAASERVFVLVDVWHKPDEDDPTLSASLVGAIRDAFDPVASGVGVLIGAAASETAPEGVSPFLRLWLAAMENGPELLKKSGQAVTSAVYEAMKRDAARFHKVAAIGFFAGRGDFPLLFEPTIVVGKPSRPPRSGKPSVPPPSLPPNNVATPDVDEAWRAGSAAFHAGQHQEAIDHYKRALLLLGQKPERAELYYRIGRAKEALGSPSEAINNYDKALGIEPLHREAVDHALELLREQKDYSRIEKIHKRRFEAHQAPSERARELEAIARMWFDEARNMQQAAGALERWLAVDENTEGWEKLVEAHLALERPAAANEARKCLARLLEDDTDRARVLVAAARTAAAHLPNGGDAIELARQALEDDPTQLEALEVSANLLGTRRRWRELAELYEWLLERLREPQVVWDLSKKLGQLCLAELEDKPGAIRAYVRALEANPSDIDLRFELVDLYQASSDWDRAASSLCEAANWTPSEPRVYRRALACFEKLKDGDRAWLAASVLDELGDADINESLLADTHRPEGLISPQAVFDAEMITLLRPERDEKLERVLSLIRDAAIRMAAAKAGLPALDAATLQDPNSTTTLVRSCTWASKVLNVDAPKLHVLADVPAGMAVYPIAEPTVIAARSLGSGFGLPELAFLWARTLVLLLPEHRLLSSYPTKTELGKLLLGALAIAEVEGADVEGDVAELADELEAELDDETLEELRVAAKALGRRRIRSRVETFARSVSAAATRAGLIAAGDVSLAIDLARRFPLPGDVSLDEQLADIRAYAISSEHRTLRGRLGVALAN
jgi:tetratricopeptide (TPR) repeat protein